MAEAEATALIAAAGSGQRLGAGGPKALVPLGGRPLIAWCLEAIAAAATITRAVIAAPPGYESEIGAAAVSGLETEVVAGGGSRVDSVAAAFERVDRGLVAIHDAARPLVTPELIDAIVERLAADVELAGVIAATPVTDTVKRLGAGGSEIVGTEDRDHLWAAQTPQAFRYDSLAAALAAPEATLAAATDEAMLVERSGGTVVVEPGGPDNFKVTMLADLRRAELLVAERTRR